MVFAKQLREGVRRGRIRCSVRIWQRPKVKVGGRYPMDDGHIVVDSVESIARREITRDLARESGFASVKELMAIAQHGTGRNVYLIRFHYLRPGAWDSEGRVGGERRVSGEGGEGRVGGVRKAGRTGRAE